MEIIKSIESSNPELRGKAIKFSMYEEGMGENMHNVGLVKEVKQDRIFLILSDTSETTLYLKDYKNENLRINVLA